MIISKNYEVLREQARLLGHVFSLLLQREALRQKRYHPDQPLAPAGQSNGGQWVSADGEDAATRVETGNADLPAHGSAETSGPEAKILLAGGLEGVDPQTNIDKFISENCLGKIRRRMPGQFYEMTIGDMLILKKAGDRDAITCYKPLNEGEYRK